METGPFTTSPFAFMPPPQNGFMAPPLLSQQGKGFWTSWGPVLCIAVVTVLLLLIGYLYIFQNKQQQQLPGQAIAAGTDIHQVTAADMMGQPAATGTQYTQVQFPSSRHPPPPPPPPQPAPGNVVHSNVPVNQVEFD